MKLYSILCCFLVIVGIGNAKNIYVDGNLGKASNSGLTKSAPLQSILDLRSIEFEGGDTLFFAAGQVYTGGLTLENIQATEDRPVFVTSFGSDSKLNRAQIDGKGEESAISLINCSGVVIEHLSIQADGGGEVDPTFGLKPMRCGILVLANEAGTYSGIKISQVDVSNIFYPEAGTQRGDADVKTANGTQPYGWGIRVISSESEAILKGISILDCTVHNVGHTGIKFTVMKNAGEHRIFDFLIEGNKVTQSGGPGIQMSGVRQGLVSNNHVDASGNTADSRKWGRGSGLWTWGSEDVVIEHNSFTNANGPADSAGAHIDFNCRNIVMQYNLSANNAGGFCEILGNNYNCCYRYNISVNDGHRVKGENGAFQEGKIFWLSGYRGNEQERAGPYNSYFYNNTIFVSKDIEVKIAVAKVSEGVLIANNIFHIEGASKAVLGDQYKKAEAAEAGSIIPNVIFTNNVFRYSENWSEDILIQPTHSFIGDVNFVNPGSLDAKGYIAKNQELILNTGIEIDKITGDSIGLQIGLKVENDILGNPIIGKPDIGAIEFIEID